MARNLHDSLLAAEFDVRTVAPDQLPTSIAALSAFDAVVLADVPLRDLPPPAVALLPGYVRNLGRGLAMIGGRHTFGAGGYRGSPIENLLPVTMDLRPQVQNPAVAVVVVIDISGSMTASEDGVTKMHPRILNRRSSGAAISALCCTQAQPDQDVRATRHCASAAHAEGLRFEFHPRA